MWACQESTCEWRVSLVDHTQIDRAQTLCLTSIAKFVTIVCACFFLCGSRNLPGGMWDKLDILQFVICTFIGMCVQLKLCNICHIVFTVQSFVLRGLLISEGGLIVSGN